jgi:hypothetical protein
MIASLDTGVIKSFNFVLQLILISVTRSAMSCRPWEESSPDPETPNPVTPTKPPRNAEAGQDNPDVKSSECQYDSNEPFRKKRKSRTETKKRELHLIVYLYVPIKRWLTDDRADMDEEEMMFDVAEEAHKEMLLSGFKKAIHPKPTNLGLWKKGQVHESRGIIYTIYRCPMSGRA